MLFNLCFSQGCMNHVLRAITRVQKGKQRQTYNNHFFSLLQKRDHYNKMKVMYSKIHFQGCQLKKRLLNFQFRQICRAPDLYLFKKLEGVFQKVQTWVLFIQGWNLQVLGGKFIFKLYSLIHAYIFKYINIQLPHLKCQN